MDNDTESARGLIAMKGHGDRVKHDRKKSPTV